jgi:putative phosphoribosyl transferase
MDRRFADRRQAGRALARMLDGTSTEPDPIVLALPRGGVPVGFEVAAHLGAPLEAFVVRKLGVPGHEELAFGAVASGGALVLNHDVVRGLDLPTEVIETVTERERRELTRREREYRGDRPMPDIAGRCAILVDDGLATGASMRAAVAAARRLDPIRLIVAVPVGAPSTCEELANEVDEVVCAIAPAPFHAVGVWYDRFDQTTDEEVRALLAEAHLADAK